VHAAIINMRNCLIVNGDIIVHGGDRLAERQTDDQLVKAVIAANPVLLERIKFVPNVKSASCNGMYYCDPSTNVWSQEHNVVLEKVLIEMFDKMQLPKADKKHIQSRRGRGDILYCLAAEVVDKTFLKKLDANLDLFAVDNGGWDMSDDAAPPRFRPLTLDDCVMTTTGWKYDPVQAVEKRPELDAFLTMVLPVEEERTVCLKFVASLLSGRRNIRKFLEFTDRCAGNNGKSALVTLFREFFGNYTANKDTFNADDCPKMDVADQALWARAMVVPFRSKFVAPQPDGEPSVLPEHTYPMDLLVNERFRGWLSALADVFLEHFDPTGVALLSLPASMTQWKSAGDTLDTWLDSHYEITGDAADKVVFKETVGAHGLSPHKFMSCVRAYFTAKGCWKAQTSIPKEGGGFKNARNVAVGVRALSLLPGQEHNTSSPMENLFRQELKRILGYDMPKARPSWLLYPLTNRTLELDFYDQERSKAIEYDGRQHYEYPNAFHKTRAEFDQQVMRDVWKDAACRLNGVQLARVRATSDVAADVMQAVSTLNLVG
jgi:hypothetical protein